MELFIPTQGFYITFVRFHYRYRGIHSWSNGYCQEDERTRLQTRTSIGKKNLECSDGGRDAKEVRGMPAASRHQLQAGFPD